MKRLAVLGCLASCGPGPRDQPAETADAASSDVIAFPDGAWEPDPGPGRTDAHLFADGSGIWFVYGRSGPMGAGEVWLTKTTDAGDVIVAPTRVDGPEVAAWPQAIARSGSNIAIAFHHSAGSLPPRLRMFDASGQPLRDEGHLVPMSVPEMDMRGMALAARADGTMRLFATYESPSSTAEVTMVDLDAAGDPVGEPALFGTADGSVPSTVAAAFAADGSTLVAWDRDYDICHGFSDPDATLLANVAVDGIVGTPTDVGPAGGSDWQPSIASLGSTAYLAWTSTTDAGAVIRLARASEPPVVLAQLGIAPLGNHAPMIALAEPGRGALAWITDEYALRIASFRDDGTNVIVGPVHAIPLESLDSLRGVVHMGDDRYVVSWTDNGWSPQASRLFALVVDLATPPKPVPDRIDVALSRIRGAPRCSH